MNNKRLGMIFATGEDKIYFYDSGSGKVIECSDVDKQIFEYILNNEIAVEEAFKNKPELLEFIKKENILKCPERQEFFIPSKEEFKEALKGSCNQIIIELTEACNLRCEYCIYNEHHPNYRGFSTKRMSFEVAKSSIDYVLKNSKKDEFSLTFYGGEPLLEFDLMKECIEYTLKEYPELKLDVSFTSNLTLLTEDMIDYFNNTNLQSINIMCSMDGPQKYHDRYRKYLNGKGSYSTVIKNFKLLRDKFFNPDNNRLISINCVLTPPYMNESFNEIGNFFYDYLKLDDRIMINYSYLDRGEMDFSNQKIIGEDFDRLVESSPLEEWAVNKFLQIPNSSQIFDIISKDLAKIGKRLRADDGLITQTYLHGNCIPGQRRLYVTTSGEFRVCEKTGNAFSLGDYKNGYDFDKIYKIYYKDYVKYFSKICKDCWAQNLCAVCYEKTIGEQGVIEGIEKNICPGVRRVIRDAFINYYRLLENDEELLREYIEKYKFE